MKITFSFLTLILGSLCCIGQGSGKYNSKDLAYLNSLPLEFAHYWNIHNIDSIGTMLTEDVDFITGIGIWLRGKDSTVTAIKRAHSMMLKSSVFTIDSVQIKNVKSDLAIIYTGWGIKGDIDPDGTPRKPRHGIFTWVVVKKKAKWLIQTSSNVDKK